MRGTDVSGPRIKGVTEMPFLSSTFIQRFLTESSPLFPSVRSTPLSTVVVVSSKCDFETLVPLRPTYHGRDQNEKVVGTLLLLGRRI